MMKTMMILAGAAALGLAGAAIAQDTPPATPMQGSPPFTNTPAGASSDATAPSAGAAGDATATPADSAPPATGSTTAPVTKPLAGTNTNPTDAPAMTKHKHKPKG